MFIILYIQYMSMIYKYIILQYSTLRLVFFLGAAVPPWVGYNDEDTVQQQILALSAVSIIPHKKFVLK